MRQVLHATFDGDSGTKRGNGAGGHAKPFAGIEARWACPPRRAFGRCVSGSAAYFIRMSAQNTTTAAESYVANLTEHGDFLHIQTSFVCPYPDCGVFAHHDWGQLQKVSVSTEHVQHPSRILQQSELRVALCAACHRDVVFLDGELVKPATSEAPAPHEDMPSIIMGEYNEAAAILPGSPRGAAALLRLAVQKLLPELGAKKADINDQIGELVGRGTLPSRVFTALDALRVIGNEAVHPGTIDLKDNPTIAMGLFRLLNFIVEKAISEPKHTDEMFALLPQGKRDAIVTRDQKAIARAKQNGEAPRPAED